MNDQLSQSRFPDLGTSGRNGSRRGRRAVARAIGPEDFFHAALDILAEHGAETLTTARMCERVLVTKGSFYHHFGGMDDFVKAFAEYRESLLADMLAIAATELDPLVRMSVAVSLIAMLPHEAEAALRAWSHSNSTLEASQRRIDRACVDIAVATAQAVLGDARRAAIVGRQLIALIIGFQQMDRPTDRESLVIALAAFGESSCGLVATLTPGEAFPSVEFSRPV